MTQTAVRSKPEIKSAAICRCTDRMSSEVFYLVKSDSQFALWYEVRWNDARHEWQCRCPATKPCKHERAVNEVLRAKAAEKQAEQERYLEYEAACGHYSIPGLY